MKYYISLAPILIAAIGCATASTTPTGNAKVAVPAMEMPKEYSVSLVTRSARNGKLEISKSCPTQAGQMKNVNWKALVQMANACAQEGQWQRLESVADELAQREQLAPWGAYYKSIVAFAQKDYSRSLWMVELALKKAPKMGLLHYQKARVFWAQDQLNAAVDGFHMALKFDGQLVDPHLMLGQLYLRNQDYAAAARHLEAVLNTEPMNFIAISGLAEVRIHQNDGKEALNLLSRAIRREPNDLNLRLRRAVVYETIERDYERALVSYKELRVLMKQSNSQWKSTINIDEKIKTLEATLAKSEPGRKMSDARDAR